MNDDERAELLDRMDRPSATIGADLPDEITLEDGTTLDVNAFVMECHSLETVPEAQREAIEDVKSTLRRERLRRRQRVQRDDLSYATAEILVESVHGLDRALNALEGLGEPAIGEQLRQKQLDDARDLLTLVDRAP